MSKESLSITTSVLDKITGTTGDILERRYPGESLQKQMLKSPDVLIAGAIAAGVLSISVAPVEIAVDSAISLTRCLKKPESSKE